MAESVNKKLILCFQMYRKWITQNPQMITDIESTFKFISFFAASRFHTTSLLSEFIYSLPNLFVLFNDRLINSSSSSKSTKNHQAVEKIKIWLTVVDYTEAILEISAKKLFGDSGKWLLIILIQILKSALRLLLVFRYKERIVKTPAIPPLNREKLRIKENEECIPEGFSLKRSGTVVRSVENSSNSSNSQNRLWTPLVPPICTDRSDSNFEYRPVSQKKLILAEVLYIIKPLLHLGCISMKGQKHWNPWLLSLITDLASLRLFSEETKSARFSKEEKEEICRRRIGLLLYLLRSPFYDSYSRKKIYYLLDSFSKSVPLAKLLTDPIAKYLPHWQNTYFYMWSC